MKCMVHSTFGSIQGDLEGRKDEKPLKIKESIDIYEIDFSNSTNEPAEVYKAIKSQNPKDKLLVHNPDMCWYKWLREVKNCYIPSVFSRICGDKYKHGSSSDILDKDDKCIMFVGMRKYESTKRADYD